MRVNKVTAIIGRRGTGKTTYIRKLMKSYGEALPYQKILILDTLDHPDYRDIPNITIDQLKRWNKPSIYRMYGKDTDEMLQAVEENLKNALLILEDSSKYLRRTISNEVRSFIFDSKQKNLDIIFLFHGFQAMPDELFRIVDNLVIFKTDNPKYRKSALTNYDEVEQVYNRVMNNPSPYYNETIQIY